MLTFKPCEEHNKPLSVLIYETRTNIPYLSFGRMIGAWAGVLATGFFGAFHMRWQSEWTGTPNRRSQLDQPQQAYGISSNSRTSWKTRNNCGRLWKVCPYRGVGNSRGDENIFDSVQWRTDRQWCVSVFSLLRLIPHGTHRRLHI